MDIILVIVVILGWIATTCFLYFTQTPCANTNTNTIASKECPEWKPCVQKPNRPIAMLPNDPIGGVWKLTEDDTSYPTAQVAQAKPDWFKKTGDNWNGDVCPAGSWFGANFSDGYIYACLKELPANAEFKCYVDSSKS